MANLFLSTTDKHRRVVYRYHLLQFLSLCFWSLA